MDSFSNFDLDLLRNLPMVDGVYWPDYSQAGPYMAEEIQSPMGYGGSSSLQPDVPSPRNFMPTTAIVNTFTPMTAQTVVPDSESRGVEEDPRMSWYQAQIRCFRDAKDLRCAYLGRCVPQPPYTPKTNKGLVRCMAVEWKDAIYFERGNSSYGLLINDACAGRVRDLKDPNGVVLNTGPSISIRINWPGYAEWTKQVAAKDWRKDRAPLPRNKVAKIVGKTVKCFFEEVEKGNVRRDILGTEEQQSTWRIKPDRIKLENIILVSLHQVSKGSWQPFLRVKEA